MFRAPKSLRSAKSRLQSLADEELMALVHERDHQAFEVIFARHVDAAFSLAYRMCGRRSTAEDVVQEAFLSLWRNGTRYDQRRGSVRSWLLGVVHNQAIDNFRRARVRTGRDVPDDGLAERMPANTHTAEEVERRDQASQVRGALRDLPDEQRQVVELAYFGGFTHNQIADMLELPPGTVKGRMRLALSKLRVSLGGLEGGVAL